MLQLVKKETVYGNMKYEMHKRDPMYYRPTEKEYLDLLNQEYECIFRQLDIEDPTEVGDYEVLCYQKGKLEEIKVMLLEEESKIPRPFDSPEAVGQLTGRDLEQWDLHREFISTLLEICKKRLRKVEDTLIEIFGRDLERLEQRLINSNNEFREIKEESEEKIEEADSKISKVMDCLSNLGGIV